MTPPRSPETTINLFAQYNFEISDLDSWLRLDSSYRSEVTSDIEAVVSALVPEDTAVSQSIGLYTQYNGTGIGNNGVPVPWPGREITSIPSYDVFNLRAGISGERWAITAYVENLTDENYYTGTQENFGIGGFRIRPHFRVYGINIRFFSQ